MPKKGWEKAKERKVLSQRFMSLFLLLSFKLRAPKLSSIFKIPQMHVKSDYFEMQPVTRYKLNGHFCS